MHRDVKPHNIFVSSSGDIRVGDFGLCRYMAGQSNSFSEGGTDAYMPPGGREINAYMALVHSLIHSFAHVCAH